VIGAIIRPAYSLSRQVMAAVLIQQIEAEIAEANRLIAELRFTMALAQSSDEDTAEMQVRLQEMLRFCWC
jgi:hypothetical protein